MFDPDWGRIISVNVTISINMLSRWDNKMPNYSYLMGDIFKSDFPGLQYQRIVNLDKTVQGISKVIDTVAK